MPSKIYRRNLFSGLPSALGSVQQEPIIENRAPTAADMAELGAVWVDRSADAFYILCDIANGAAVWQGAVGGATVLASLTVNPGNATITAGNLIVTAGDITAAAGTATLGTLIAGMSTLNALDVTTDAQVGGNLTVVGDVIITGDFDITSADQIVIQSTNNGVGAITLLVNGGAAETLLIQSAQGTSADAIHLDAQAGAVHIESLNGFVIEGTDAASAGAINYGTGDLLITGANGDFTVVTGTGAINIGTDAVQHNLVLGNITGTTTVTANTGTGGFIVNTTGAGTVDINSGSAVTIDAVTSVSIDSATASNVTVTGAGQDLTISSVGGRVVISGTEVAADAVEITAPNGGFDFVAANTSLLSATAAGQDMIVRSDLGSVVISGGEAVADAVQIIGNDVAAGLLVNFGTGGMAFDTTGAFSIDGAAASNVTVTGAGADLTVSSAGGSVVVTSSEAVANAVTIQASNAAGGVVIDSNGLVAVDPAVDTQASPSAASTLDFRVLRVIFTGFTTAMGASQAFTINSNQILATSGIFVGVTNLDASTNGAFLTIDGIVQAAGSIVVNVTNNGAGALGAGDNIIITVWIIS